MSTWLAIETSSPTISLSVGSGETCTREVSSTGSASTSIAPLFQQLDVKMESIDSCIIGQGPGSYNGLRVGYGFLKGLLCLSPKPVIQVPTPLLMARMAHEQLGDKKDGSILVINNARRGELYGAICSIKQGVPSVVSQNVCTKEILLQSTPDDLIATATYEFDPDQLPEWNEKPVLKIYPKSSVAAQIALTQKIAPAPSLVVIEPHYVRSAVPETLVKQT